MLLTVTWYYIFLIRTSSTINPPSERFGLTYFFGDCAVQDKHDKGRNKQLHFHLSQHVVFATTGFILRHWLVVTKIAGCDILNFLVVVTDYADGFGSYINIYTAGKSGTALLLLRLAFLQNSLQGIAPLDV